MTGCLLDTNVLSELRRPKPERKLLEFVGGQPLDPLYVTAVTFAEIRFEIELVAEPGRRAELNDWLGLFLFRRLPVAANRLARVGLLTGVGRPTWLGSIPSIARRCTMRG